MAMYSVTCTQVATVNLKEEAFTDEFMQEFRDYMYDFKDTKEHAEHIGQLAARGVYPDLPFNLDCFVKGYGNIGEFVESINLLPLDLETRQQPTTPDKN